MKETKLHIGQQAQAIHHFITKMDIEMIASFLDNDQLDADLKKDKFIGKLGQAFEKFSEAGDTFLIAYDGKCACCDRSRCGFTYVGNNSKKYISLILELSENKIKDIYFCSIFNTRQYNLDLNEQVRIKDDEMDDDYSMDDWDDEISEEEILSAAMSDDEISEDERNEDEPFFPK